MSKNEKTIPDARWINQKLDIRRVAVLLEIRHTGDRWHCWRPQNHRNGDADPSVRYWAEMNRLKCFVCPGAAIGAIDLVMEVSNCTFEQALEWLATKFEVPMIPARQKSERTGAPRRYLEQHMEPMELLVKMHIYQHLGRAARLLAPVLLAVSEKTSALGESPRTVTISYAAIRRYSGIKSPNSIRAGIQELEMLGWLHPHSNPQRGLVKAVGSYTITPYAEVITELGHSLAKEEHAVIALERKRAKERRADRQRGPRRTVQLAPETP
jgi:hypothetical protein